jgi:hypothetical protein
MVAGCTCVELQTATTSKYCNPAKIACYFCVSLEYTMCSQTQAFLCMTKNYYSIHPLASGPTVVAHQSGCCTVTFRGVPFIIVWYVPLRIDGYIETPKGICLLPGFQDRTFRMGISRVSTATKCPTH